MRKVPQRGPARALLAAARRRAPPRRAAEAERLGARGLLEDPSEKEYHDAYEVTWIRVYDSVKDLHLLVDCDFELESGEAALWSGGRRLDAGAQLAALDAGRPPEPSDVVYERGFPANFATLVLSGKLSVKAGVDGFRAEAGPWTLLGAGALRDENFVPDFSAHVATDSVRCVYLSHAEKSNAPRRARKDDMRRSPSRERRRLRRDRRVGDRRGARSALGLGRELGRPAGRRDPSSRSLSFDSPVR